MSHGKGNHKSIRQALEYVAKNPEWPETSRLEMPIWELIARNLFDMAYGNETGRMAQNRRTRAQKIILDRYSGTRRTGTAPAVKHQKEVKIHDLTVGAPEEDSTPAEVTL